MSGLGNVLGAGAGAGAGVGGVSETVEMTWPVQVNKICLGQASLIQRWIEEYILAIDPDSQGGDGSHVLIDVLYASGDCYSYIWDDYDCDAKKKACNESFSKLDQQIHLSPPPDHTQLASGFKDLYEKLADRPRFALILALNAVGEGTVEITKEMFDALSDDIDCLRRELLYRFMQSSIPFDFKPDGSVPYFAMRLDYYDYYADYSHLLIQQLSSFPQQLTIFQHYIKSNPLEELVIRILYRIAIALENEAVLTLFLEKVGNKNLLDLRVIGFECKSIGYEMFWSNEYGYKAGVIPCEKLLTENPLLSSSFRIRAALKVLKHVIYHLPVSGDSLIKTRESAYAKIESNLLQTKMLRLMGSDGNERKGSVCAALHDMVEEGRRLDRRLSALALLVGLGGSQGGPDKRPGDSALRL